MRRTRRTLVATLIAALAAVAVAVSAQAQMLGSPTTQGALVVTPYLTDTDRVTVTAVTNTTPINAVRLHVTFISGTDWTGIDRDCVLTPFETTYFIFESFSATQSKVTFECSNVDPVSGAILSTDIVNVAFANGANGVMVVAVENPAIPPQLPSTVFANVLLADTTVLDFAGGFAFSVNGWHYQGLGAGPGDRDYIMDGLTEYTANPVGVTSNFISPDDDITAELILFTPDGRVGGGPGIQAGLFGFAYDDDENPTSGQINYDCFTITALDASPNGFGPNVRRDINPNNPIVGHLSLTADFVVRDDIHELVPPHGDANGARTAPSIGWLVQTIAAGGDLDDGNFPMGGATMAAQGAWARQLIQQPQALIPLQADLPGIDAR